MTNQMTTVEILENLRATIHTYKTALETYTDEQFALQQADGGWSLAQMYEHLHTTANFFFLANTQRCLDQRKGQLGGEKNDHGLNLYKYGGFPPVKIKIPEVLRGPEPVGRTRAEYAPLLDKIVDDYAKMAQPVAQDLGAYKCIQPAFGWLNAHEWYHIGEMHLRHHLRQKAELEGYLNR